MNRNQAIALALAAANIALIMLFPPFDTYSIVKSQIPVFGGFYFYPNHDTSLVLNSSLLFLELFVVAINAGIALLLLGEKEARLKRGQMSLQNATLIFVAINLVVILLFPPFESVFAISKASIPTFEGFYFIFARQKNHVIVTAVLYLEVFFMLINGAIFWLIFRDKNVPEQSPEEAARLMIALRKRGG
jgi:hypothetical protein